jgi:hypothetical protein
MTFGFTGVVHREDVGVPQAGDGLDRAPEALRAQSRSDLVQRVTGRGLLRDGEHAVTVIVRGIIRTSGRPWWALKHKTPQAKT